MQKWTWRDPKVLLGAATASFVVWSAAVESFAALTGADWPAWVKWAAVLVLVAIVLGSVWHAGRPRPAEPDPSPRRRLTELYKATGAIAPGWFVSFTMRVSSTKKDATAIAEVDGVDGEEVSLRWRDENINGPATVQVALLDAHEVTVDRHGVRTRTGNRGLSGGNGGRHVGMGWAAHRRSPAQLLQVGERARDLAGPDLEEFQEELSLQRTPAV